MNHYQLTELVRQQVREAFLELGAAEGPPHETLLIRDNHFCGRRFELDGMTAVWFMEEAQIKCFARDGALQKVLRPLGATQRRAA